LLFITEDKTSETLEPSDHISKETSSWVPRTLKHPHPTAVNQCFTTLIPMNGKFLKNRDHVSLALYLHCLAPCLIFIG
jgi:hypothetical protein